MANVHRLGDVWRTEIDDDGARILRRFIKEMQPLQGARESSADRFALKAEIEESGAGDFDGFTPLLDIELSDDLLGELTRIAFAFLRQRHEGVALVIAEFRVRARAHLNRRRIGI